MLDPAFVRDNLDLVRTGLRNRGLDPDGDLGKLAAIEARRRAIIPEAEGLKQQQNRSGEEIFTGLSLYVMEPNGSNVTRVLESDAALPVSWAP